VKSTLALALAAGCLVVAFARPGESQAAYRAPRTAAGQPDLNGFWQALNTAHWDLEAHEAAAGPVIQLGAAPTSGGFELLLAERPDLARVVIAPHDWPDPYGGATHLLVADTQSVSH